MILYDGKRWLTLVKWHGSVIPKALPYAMLVGIIATALKYFDDIGLISISNPPLVTNSVAYTGFSTALSFVLVFRSSQCYSRFWSCAQSACTMRAQVCESAGSLITFSMMTKGTKEECSLFAHKVVRLFSLLHAVALQQIADEADEDFRTIDSASLGPAHLSVLSKLDGKGRVDMVYQWIGALIMQSTNSGLLAVPPPILSRVFQEMEKAMIEYNQVLQVMTVPFPFPYAQVSVILLNIYMIITPFIMTNAVSHPAVAGIFAGVSVLCMVSLEFIAAELEGPLGDDENDLPCYRWQEDLNEVLLSFLSPWCQTPPDLLPTAILDLHHLEEKGVQSLNCIMADTLQFPHYDKISPHEVWGTLEKKKSDPEAAKKAAPVQNGDSTKKTTESAATTSTTVSASTPAPAVSQPEFEPKPSSPPSGALRELSNSPGARPPTSAEMRPSTSSTHFQVDPVKPSSAIRQAAPSPFPLMSAASHRATVVGELPRRPESPVTTTKVPPDVGFHHASTSNGLPQYSKYAAAREVRWQQASSPPDISRMVGPPAVVNDGDWPEAPTRAGDIQAVPMVRGAESYGLAPYLVEPVSPSCRSDVALLDARTPPSGGLQGTSIGRVRSGSPYPLGL